MRVGGTARKNLTAFGKLCGDNALRIAVVVTTMWDGRDVGELETREHQLRTSPQLFEPFLAKGAKLLRHDNTTDAVHRILKEVISMKPLPLKIQEELVVEKRRLIDTDAAVYLEGELRVKAEEYKREIEELREEMREALSNMDLELEKELQRNKADLEDRLKKAKQEHESLSSQYAAERRRLEIMNKKQDITILQDSDIQRRPNVRGRETDVSSHEDHPIVFIGKWALYREDPVVLTLNICREL